VSTAPDRPDGATWREWGIDPAWSRTLSVASHDGHAHEWHVLDTGPAPTASGATIVCVHGNPTWAYAWKSFLVELSSAHRVIAVDQLGMGYSDRVAHRPYAERVLDLGDVIDALDLDDSVVLAAHDWGGAISMGWAVDHVDRVRGMVLCNTGIGVPEGRGAPKIIRLAATDVLRDLVCRRTNGFVEGTVRLSGRRIDATDRQAFRAPYRLAEHRAAIADFVGDVPLTSPHPSEGDLARVSGLLSTVEAPVLLAWGTNDIVFDDDFANDLAGKFPNARVERFAGANHLVMAEADVAGSVDVWLDDLTASDDRPHRPAPTGPATSVFDGLERRRHDDIVAVHDDATGASVSFRDFVARVDRVAESLVERGVQPGDRVAMLTPPGVDLLVAVYGVWRAGAVTVIADRGLGLSGLGAAVASARPSWTIGTRAARVASATLRWAPRAGHIDIDDLMGTAASRSGAIDLPVPDDDAEIAVLFTSGATGPAKGVRYLHRQLAAQRDALAATYSITDDDRLVAAFAPFALYGPSLGVATALTDCDVTTPGALTAQVLDSACRAVDATMMFASPAALTNVVATSETATWPGIAALRLVFSAGAPVPSEILRSMQALAPASSLHTPYGMTEALPVADIDLDGIESADSGPESHAGGVCVGTAVAGMDVRIAALGFDAMRGVPEGLTDAEMGEILVRSDFVSEGYLGRWRIERAARPGGGWHRTGDVGRIDGSGRLWVDGRAVHVIDGVDGPITPVPLERAVERALGPRGQAVPGRVAAVGVGPGGRQQTVVVLERRDGSDGLAPAADADAVRAALAVPVAAVLTMIVMPVDIRHNAKIDRVAVADWAADVLAGRPTGGTSIGQRLAKLRRRVR